MTTITVFHNVQEDAAGRPSGMLDGYRATDRLVPVFQCDIHGLAPTELLEQTFQVFNIGEDDIPAAPQLPGPREPVPVRG